MPCRTDEALTRFDHLIRIADRLGQVPAGSPEADQAIHDVLGRAGTVLPYTTETGAAAQLIPPGFEWREGTYAGGQVYASCRRSGTGGKWRHPHHGQWGTTEPLAMCRAVLRAWAKLPKGRSAAAILATVDRVT
ncbi:hypothetical protein JMJ56_29330 [Belnapia sp. T18]|uniref:Uncharacterized protein n=1 Tax=Belnapia arida TaxID=2804533 RepID=A0ABS1UBL1_9PROT|nr:hypothetical protein [Belnapia arida]MBL6082083.1 hypothetical protein [Belnapia arida]